jgi:hypothetical protein
MLIKVYFHFITAGAFIVTTYDTKDYAGTLLETTERSVQNIIKVCILLSHLGGMRDKN